LQDQKEFGKREFSTRQFPIDIKKRVSAPYKSKNVREIYEDNIEKKRSVAKRKVKKKKKRKQVSVSVGTVRDSLAQRISFLEVGGLWY